MQVPCKRADCEKLQIYIYYTSLRNVKGVKNRIEYILNHSEILLAIQFFFKSFTLHFFHQCERVHMLMWGVFMHAQDIRHCTDVAMRA